MAEDGKVVFKIEGDASQAMQAVDQFEQHARTGAQRVESAAKESSKGTETAVKEAMTNTENTVMASADKIATALGAAFAAKKIMDFGKYSVGVASDLSEVQNVVDTTFGQEGAQKINEWAMSAAEMFGESELQAKQFTSTIGAMFKSMGLGQKVKKCLSESPALRAIWPRSTTSTRRRPLKSSALVSPAKLSP